jgi:NAD(P)-dependent dehydrogenase (short-subunit alcohol dehydrogenase family)
MGDRDRYTGKVAFVTGAAGGIGRATALAFAREGASVVVADVDEQANAETARLIEAEGGQVIAVRCDVTSAEDVQAALHLAVETFGGLDVAFNNAGIEQSGSAAAAARGWRDRQHVVGRRRQGFATGAAYGAAKFGIIGATKCAGLDYASSGIRINAVCPGIIDTQMIERVFGDTPEGRQAVLDQEPIGRMGQPEEIAAAVLWLCSEEASFAIGHALVIDGGQTT